MDDPTALCTFHVCLEKSDSYVTSHHHTAVEALGYVLHIRCDAVTRCVLSLLPGLLPSSLHAYKGQPCCSMHAPVP